jgi:AAA domain/DnaB-like helicase N terminal domain
VSDRARELEPPAPQNLEAEELVLGAIMLAGATGREASSTTLAAIAASGLEASDFYRASHAHVYAAALAVDERGEPVDVLALEAELRRWRSLRAAGGKVRLHELAALAPAFGNAGHYARLVVEAAELREELDVALALKATVENGGLVADDALRERLARLLEPRRVENAFSLETFTAAALAALPDPPASDHLLGPLVVRGARTIVVGDTGHGKTTFVLQAVRAVLAGEELLEYRGIGAGRALVVDAEQGLRSIKRVLREVRLAERDDVVYVHAPDGLALDSEPAHRAALERLIAAHEPVVVVLDPYYKCHRGEANEERAVVDLMRELDAMRAQYGFGLILPAHPRKEALGREGYRRLTLHDVAGSGALTRGAEVVVALERLAHGYARLRVLKDRDGDLPVGEAIGLVFDRDEGFRLDPREQIEQEELDERLLELADDRVWRTVKEWSSALEIGETRARAMLERLTEAGRLEYEQGPADRHSSARCWRGAS